MKIQCEMTWGEQPLPIKNKNSLKVSLSLIRGFRKLTLTLAAKRNVDKKRRR